MSKTTPTIATFNQGFEMHRNAKVETHMERNFRGKESLVVTINDKHRHTASATSSWTDRAKTYGPEMVQDHLQGGTFFINSESGQVVSHQLKSYNGFVHSDENINQLLDHIGHSNAERTNRVQLSSVHSNMEIQFPNMDSGGDFNSELSFLWDPFQSHVRANFKLIRMICSNGMVGLSDFMNCKIPIVNEWVEHLQIANAQIQNKVENMLRQRINIMTREPASVRDCQRVVDAGFARIKSSLNLSDERATRLRNIIAVCDPQIHLKSHYPDSVFLDRRLSEQTASHLSEFTVWNMLTEMATHTDPVEDSTTLAVQKHANGLLIPANNAAKVSRGQQNVEVRFDDVDAAFAGDLLAG